MKSKCLHLVIKLKTPPRKGFQISDLDFIRIQLQQEDLLDKRQRTCWVTKCEVKEVGGGLG